MPHAYRFAIRPFGCNFLFAAEDHEAYAVLERYIFPSLTRTRDTDGAPDVFIRIAADAGRFHLLVHDRVIASACRAANLAPELIRALDDLLIGRLTGFCVVHAGVVLLGGRALLLPGVTHAGKSSLVAELLRHGATYFSDEYALIDPEGRVHPYPRPLLLRNENSERFPVLPEECNAPVGNAPAPVGFIVSLKYVPASPWALRPISQSEALLGLLRNTPHSLAESTGMIGAFQNAVAGAACYEGRRPEAADAANQILRLVANP